MLRLNVEARRLFSGHWAERSGDGGKQPKMLIFAMKARKLLRNGYEGYLANTIGPLREG